MNRKYVEKVLIIKEKEISVILQPLRSSDALCSLECPYGLEVCKNLPDPSGDRNTFTGFCFDLFKYCKDKNKDELNYYIPTPGTIEKIFDEDIFYLLRKSNPYIRINKVIDLMCNGICEFYKKGCTKDNKTCILYDLLLDGKGKTR